jgi:hypothetical protein
MNWSNMRASPLQKIHAYQQKIEFINFVAVIIRSDVAQVASKLSKFLINSSKFHMKSTNRILKYLSHIKKLIIEFNADQFLQNENENNIFLISSNAFFANDILIRYNSQEYAFKLFNNIIDWKTFKQCTIITSFIEIELLIISSADKKLIWWNRLFNIIHFRINQKTRIQCDNM